MAQRTSIGQLLGFLSKLVLFLVLLAVGAGVWGIMQEPGQLRYTHMKIKSAQWPQFWQPLKIVVVSDLHVGSPYIGLAKLESVVEMINHAKPDVVLLLGSFMPGDFFKTPISPRDFAPILARIKAKSAVLALPGIRDFQNGSRELANALKKANITLLSDNAVSITVSPKKRFWIIGFGDNPTKYPTVMAQLPKGEPVFAMVHNPARFPAIPRKANVVFAGYTHGGLVNIPEFPIPVLPSGVPKKYAYGLVRENDHQMFVTAGVGTDEYPIRLNNIPEILVVTVVSGQ